MNLDKLNLEHLQGTQRDIADVIGIEAYRKLVAVYGGCSIYVGKSDAVTNSIRDDEIYSKFDGKNYRELARIYNLAENTVRDIIYRKNLELAAHQMTFYDL